MKNSQLHVRIEQKKLEEFKKKADKKGLNSSAVIRLFVDRFNEDPDILSKLVWKHKIVKT